MAEDKGKPGKGVDEQQGEAKAKEAANQAAAAPTPGAKLRPSEWAKRKGLVNEPQGALVKALKAAGGTPENAPQLRSSFRPAHAAADALYGWSLHAYHHEQGKPDEECFRLSEQDYDAALAAALKFPAAEPHAPALPESQKGRFAGFKARRNRKDKG